METAAAGAYLCELRKQRGWTRPDLVRAVRESFDVKVGETTIKHIEDGDNNSGGATIAMVAFVLAADDRHVESLLRLPSAPATHGAALAEATLAARRDAAVAALLAIYEDAIARRDLVAQRAALRTLADRPRQGSRSRD